MTRPEPTDHGDRTTRPTADDVDAHLATVQPQARREDALAVIAMMREVTGVEPVLWGGSMVGFGRQPYRTADGKDREWFAVGLAARKAALTLYGLTSYGSRAELLERLGRHSTGKGCLYVKRLTDVDLDVLRELVERAWADNHVPG
jgi:hypothetical protein